MHRVSTLDHWRYDETEHNWRLPAGYGTLVAAHGAGLPVALDCPVRRIDHSGPLVRLETAGGTLRARRVVVTVPPPLLLTGGIVFDPALPDHLGAAVSRLTAPFDPEGGAYGHGAVHGHDH